jgi:hypothetical protein
LTPLEVTQHVGGKPGCLVAARNSWFQAIGSRIDVIDPANGATLASISLGDARSGAAIVDMAFANHALFAVLDEQAVVEVDISDPLQPRLSRRVDAEQIGIKPRFVSVVGSDVYVSGDGGVVRWRDRQRLLADHGQVGLIASTDGRLVACVGRRVLDVSSGEYLGAASDLQRWPSPYHELLVFTLRGERATTVGLMSPDIREIDRVTITDPVGRVRVFAERIWVLTDKHVTGYAFDGGRMGERVRIEVQQPIDVAPIDSNTIALSSLPGPAALWIENHLDGPRWRQKWRRDLATGLTDAWSDGRRIIVRNREHLWAFSPDSGTLDPMGPLQVKWPEPQRLAAGVWGKAQINADGTSVAVTSPPGTQTTIASTPDAMIECVASVAGDLWVGTTRGISVYQMTSSPDESNEPILRQELHIDGQVFAIIPLLGRPGAAYVTRYGGVGVVEPAPLGVQ